MPNISVMNPYTFIPFEKAPARAAYADTYSKPEELLSGWMDIELLTKRKVIIPDGANEAETDGEHKTYRFFRLPDGTPVIPGSEIRGMLRTVYEAASNSCLPFLLDDNQKSMRVPIYAALKTRGLLRRENGKWSLWSVLDRYVHVFRNEIANGVYGTQKCGDYDPVKKEWIQFSVPISKKYNVHFLKLNQCLYTWANNAPYDALKEELEENVEARKKGIHNPTHKSLLENLEKAKKLGNGCVPVWYQKVYNDVTKQDEYYISPSSIGRVNQVKHWKDIMDSYGPCGNMDQLCPACSLFGNVSVLGKGMQIKGRLRFSDALPDGGRLKANTEKILLPILSTPKPSAYEFYINRPKDAKFWNYDLYSIIERHGNRSEPVYYRNKDFSPAGRKFYWHSVEQTGKEKSNQNATMEAVQSGECFRFRLYFDRITELQLKELRWVITLGDNAADSRLQHKIGHARPMGYGSIKLRIAAETLRSLKQRNGQLTYALEKVPVQEKLKCPFARSKAIAALLAVCDTASTAGEYVSYPVKQDGANGQTIYKWFADGRNLNNGAEIQTLPETVKRKGILSEQPLGVIKNAGNSAGKPAALSADYEEGLQRPVSDIGTVIRVKVTNVIKNSETCIAASLDGKKEYTVDLKKKHVNIGQALSVTVTGTGKAERLG